MTSSLCNNLQVNYPWINESLFEKLIRQDYDNCDVVDVESYTLVPALKNGENYLSQMIRATVNYKVNQNANKKNFVIKAQIIDAPESMRQNELFSREIAVFKYIIPRIETLLRDIGDHTKISAKCYEANEEQFYLVFEDLIDRGYRNVSREIGLSVDDFKSTFSLLAKWHATTAILMETDNHLFRPFERMFSTTFYENLVKGIVKRAAQFTRECKPNCDKLATKLETMSEVIFHKLQTVNKLDPIEFNCLIHSDLWNNNIMFSDDNALLIDFQMVHNGTPALDLSYSLFSSSIASMREPEFDCLFNYYHQQLSAILNKLGYKNDIPTLATLHNQMIQRGVYGVPLGILGTIGRFGCKSETDWLTVDTEDGKLYSHSLFNNPECHDKIMFLLNYFDSKGYLDV